MAWIQLQFLFFYKWFSEPSSSLDTYLTMQETDLVFQNICCFLKQESGTEILQMPSLIGHFAF